MIFQVVIEVEADEGVTEGDVEEAVYSIFHDFDNLHILGIDATTKEG